MTPAGRSVFKNLRLSATPACPGGQTGTSRARRSVAREGTARRARGPPVRYRDKPDPIPQRCPFSQVDRQAGTEKRPSAETKKQHFANGVPQRADDTVFLKPKWITFLTAGARLKNEERPFPVGSRTGAPVGRGIPTMPRFQPPPRRTQHADFPHCAPPFASHQGLWDLSYRGNFRSVVSHSIAVEQS